MHAQLGSRSVAVLLVLLGQRLLCWRLLGRSSRVATITTHRLLVGLACRRGAIGGQRGRTGGGRGRLRRLGRVGLLRGVGARVGGRSGGRRHWGGCSRGRLLRPRLRRLLPALLRRVRRLLLVTRIRVVAGLGGGRGTPAGRTAIVTRLRRGSAAPCRRRRAPAGVRAAGRRHVEGRGACQGGGGEGSGR